MISAPPFIRWVVVGNGDPEYFPSKVDAICRVEDLRFRGIKAAKLVDRTQS